MERKDSLWVFGYGSLCWNPGFQYSGSEIGYVTGHQRRFWQGNEVHRGTPDKMGRVVTLIDDDDSEAKVWGKAFRMENYDRSKAYLDEREAILGGYICKELIFYPRREGAKPFPVLVYVATSENRQYLGDSPLHDMALQIATASGSSGHNFEYLAKLAAFMRAVIPECVDEHLFQLELTTKCVLAARGDMKLLRKFSALELDMIVGQLEEQIRFQREKMATDDTAIKCFDTLNDKVHGPINMDNANWLKNLDPLSTIQKLLVHCYMDDYGHRFTDAIFAQMNGKRSYLEI